MLRQNNVLQLKLVSVLISFFLNNVFKLDGEDTNWMERIQIHLFKRSKGYCKYAQTSLVTSLCLF